MRSGKLLWENDAVKVTFQGPRSGASRELLTRHAAITAKRKRGAPNAMPSLLRHSGVPLLAADRFASSRDSALLDVEKSRMEGRKQCRVSVASPSRCRGVAAVTTGRLSIR